MSPRQADILVVDCDDLVLSVTSQLLARMGYAVHAETKSLEALRTFSEDPDGFDLAIIEPLMPQMSGISLAVCLQRMKHGIPILFYLGYLEPRVQQQIEDAAIGSVILKPLRSKELGEAVEWKLYGSSSNFTQSVIGY